MGVVSKRGGPPVVVAGTLPERQSRPVGRFTSSVPPRASTMRSLVWASCLFASYVMWTTELRVAAPSSVDVGRISADARIMSAPSTHRYETFSEAPGFKVPTLPTLPTLPPASPYAFTAFPPVGVPSLPRIEPFVTFTAVALLIHGVDKPPSATAAANAAAVSHAAAPGLADGRV